jgi:NADH-quinone oxidoreductase subunit E
MPEEEILYERYAAEIDRLLARYASRRSAVLPLLYIAQDTYGTLTPPVIREVAEILELPYTDVFEVVSFYTLFYDQPFGKWMIQVCDDVPCCYLGAEELLSTLKEQLNVREDQVSADGLFTIQRVKCLAACQRAPVVQANLSYFYDVTAERADALLRHLREQVESPQAASVSGFNAEDYEPASDGTFRRIERLLAGAADTTQAANGASAAPSAPAPAAEPPAQAEQRAEEESPVNPAPDKSPAAAHPDPHETSDRALPPQPAQQEPPQPTSAPERKPEQKPNNDE